MPPTLNERRLFAATAAATVFGLVLERVLLIRNGMGLGSDETVYMVQALKWLGRVQPDAFVAGFRPRGIGVLLLPLLAPASPPGLRHRIAYATIGIALVWVTYAIGWRMLGRWPAAWAAAAFGLFWIHVFTSVQFLPDLASSLLASCGYLLYLDRVVDATERRPLWPITVLIAATFYLNVVVAFFALSVIGVHALASSRARARAFTREAAVALGAAAAVVLPYFIRVWMQHGSPFALIGELVNIHRHELSRVRQPIGYETYPDWFFDQDRMFGPAGGAVIIAAVVSLAVVLVLGKPVQRRHAAFLAMWLVIPTVGMALVTHAEERYLFLAYPAMFLAVGVLVRVIASTRAPHVARFAVAVALMALLPVWGVTQYGIAAARTQRYNDYYLYRDTAARVAGRSVRPPCRIYAPHAELAEIYVPCTFVSYKDETPREALDAARAFRGRTYFLVFEPVPLDGELAWLPRFLSDFGRRELLVRASGAALYSFTG